MDTRFINTSTNTLVFIDQCKYSNIVNNKNCKKYTARSANLELCIRCVVLLWLGLT